MKYEAMKRIRNEIQGVNMANVVKLDIDIPADKKEIITAFKGLINAFKNDIKVKEVENIADEIQSYEQFKTNYFSKYRGAFTGGETAEQEYNQHRVAKYGK